MAFYECEVEIQGSTTDIETLELRNPVGSGKYLQVHRLGVAADATFQTWVVKRYADPPTHGTGAVTPETGVITERDSAGNSSIAEVYYSEDPASFTWGSDSWKHTETMDASDAGDDAEIQFAKYSPTDALPVVQPGESLSVTIPAAEIPYTINLLWQEISLP